MIRHGTSDSALPGRTNSRYRDLLQLLTFIDRHPPELGTSFGSSTGSASSSSSFSSFSSSSVSSSSSSTTANGERHPQATFRVKISILRNHRGAFSRSFFQKKTHASTGYSSQIAQPRAPRPSRKVAAPATKELPTRGRMPAAVSALSDPASVRALTPVLLAAQVPLESLADLPSTYTAPLPPLPANATPPPALSSGTTSPDASSSAEGSSIGGKQLQGSNGASSASSASGGGGGGAARIPTSASLPLATPTPQHALRASSPVVASATVQPPGRSNSISQTTNPASNVIPAAAHVSNSNIRQANMSPRAESGMIPRAASAPHPTLDGSAPPPVVNTGPSDLLERARFSAFVLKSHPAEVALRLSHFELFIFQRVERMLPHDLPLHRDAVRSRC